MHNQPSGAAFDVVLLLHVACVVVGIVTVATAAAAARRLGRVAARTAAPLPEALRRYFRPGVNWAGRTVYGIPVFGFALLAMSQGAYAVTDGWVLSGLVIFLALALLCECALWPAERRLQHAVAAAATPATGPQAALPPPALAEGTVTSDAARMERTASIVLVLLVVATVLMIAQP